MSRPSGVDRGRKMVETGAQLGPYRLIRRIGSGGMAEVFLAQRIGAEGFARTVAIKTILALGAEEEGVGLFLDEARVASYLEHAAIVQTLDLGFENDTLFIVMEYVAGPALSRLIKDLKKLDRTMSPEVVAHVGARVASALDYAANRATTPDGKRLHLVHRDISPQNILLTRAGHVKLTDFGVARASVQTHKTRTGQVRGKAAYMAPEQVRAGALDGRTDIFGLALVLYEALTGVRAFQRSSDILSMRAILTDEVRPIRELNPNVPEELAAALTKALAKQPEDRFETAQAFADALQRAQRARSEAAIEAEIATLFSELFGPEQYGSGDLKVEAWQPVASTGSEATPQPTPHRLASSQLSPQIAAMLQSPGTPVSRPRVDAEHTPIFSATIAAEGGADKTAASMMPFAGPTYADTALGVPHDATSIRTPSEPIMRRNAASVSGPSGAVWLASGLGGFAALGLGIFLLARPGDVEVIPAPIEAPTSEHPTPGVTATPRAAAPEIPVIRSQPDQRPKLAGGGERPNSAGGAERSGPAETKAAGPSNPSGEAALQPEAAARPSRPTHGIEPAEKIRPLSEKKAAPAAAEPTSEGSITEFMKRANDAKQKARDPGTKNALGRLIMDVHMKKQVTPKDEALLESLENSP